MTSNYLFDIAMDLFAALFAKRSLSKSAIMVSFNLDEINFREVTTLLDDILAQYTPLTLLINGDSYCLATRQSFFDKIDLFKPDKRLPKLSSQAIETLAIIAYKQPVSKDHIDEIRGGKSSWSTINALRKTRMIRSISQGNQLPDLYLTTQQFLIHFNIKSLSELPSIADIMKMRSLDKQSS